MTTIRTDPVERQRVREQQIAVRRFDAAKSCHVCTLTVEKAVTVGNQVYCWLCVGVMSKYLV